jgi:conjugal transfer pilus assembly protein TraB
MSELQTPQNIKKKQYVVLLGVGVFLAITIVLFLSVVTGSSEPKAQQKVVESKIADSLSHRDPRDLYIQKYETENKEFKEKISSLETMMNQLIAEKGKQIDSASQESFQQLQDQITSLQQQLEQKEHESLESKSAYSYGSGDQTSKKIILNLKKNAKYEAYQNRKKVEDTIPAGAYASAILLGGVDASTSVSSANDPRPVLLRIIDSGTLPRKFKSDLKSCHVLASAHGDLSSERVYMRLEKLTCTEPLTGEISETQVAGYIAGEDGRAGVRGVVVDKTTDLMRNSLLGGFASGISNFFQSSNQGNLYPINPLGERNALTDGQMLKSGAYSGIGNALEKYADYYIKRAEQLQPVLAVQAGRKVNIIFTEGTKFGDTTVKQVISEARDQALSQSREQIQREALGNNLNQDSLNRWLPSTSSEHTQLPKVGESD